MGFFRHMKNMSALTTHPKEAILIELSNAIKNGNTDGEGITVGHNIDTMFFTISLIKR